MDMFEPGNAPKSLEMNASIGAARVLPNLGVCKPCILCFGVGTTFKQLEPYARYLGIIAAWF